MLANYFAIHDLINAEHALVWHNMRFYYDPIQAKLIPIGFDGNANAEKLQELAISKLTRENKLAFNDNELVSKYISALERVSEPVYLRSFMNNNKIEFQKIKEYYLSLIRL